MMIQKMAYFRNFKKYFYSFLLTSYFPVDLNFFKITSKASFVVGDLPKVVLGVCSIRILAKI